MPDEPIAAATAWTSPKGVKHKLPRNVPVEFVDKISAELIVVMSRRLDGADLDTCLKQAYDACVTVLNDAGAPLTLDLLTEMIPAWILRWAVIQQWYGPMPDDKSHVALGDLRIGDSTRADFFRRLRSRITYWQGISLKQAVEQPKPGRLEPSSPAQESSRAYDSTPSNKPTRPKRGRKPNEHCWAIAEIVKQHGTNWTEYPHLLEICDVLDEKRIPIPPEWGHWKDEPTLKPKIKKTLKKWSKAVEIAQGRVVKVIDQRLQMAEKYAPPTPAKVSDV